MNMFYASKFMTALAELESSIVHEHKADEDAMFDMIKRCKAEGIKPMEAAASYYLVEAERGIATAPETWLPMVEHAIGRMRLWSVQVQGCRFYAERLADLLHQAGLEPEDDS